MTDMSGVTWRKSSRSTNNGACVEVGTWRKSSRNAQQGDGAGVGADVQVIAVRDSKNPEGARLAFSRREWASFAGRVKAGPSSL